MTSTETEQKATAAERAQTFLDWTKINSRALTAGAIIVAVAAAGYWFYMRSRQIQEANAATALMTAKQSLTAGNLALAQSDLQKVFSRYGSTSSGVEAAVLLAQVYFDSGKYQDGISALQKVSGTSAASSSEGVIRSLQGDGYAQMGKLAQAAKAYESAAQAASGFDTEQSFYRAKAGRAYQAAGDTARARQIWMQLQSDPKGQSMAAEARVRLGELTATVAKK